MSDSEIEYGRLEEAVETLKRQHESLARELHLIHADLIDLKIQLATAQGGWKVIMIAGGLAAGLIGFLADFLSRLWNGTP